MNIQEHWADIRETFIRARRSGLHHAFASVNADGSPHVTPIGSLWLYPDRPQGIYLDVFNRQLGSNVNRSHRATVMAVDARYGLWLAALMRGRFKRMPALRLHGTVSAARVANPKDIERIRSLFRRAMRNGAAKRLFGELRHVRDVEFDAVSPVRIGALTRDLAA